MRVSHDFDDPEGFVFEYNEHQACYTNIDGSTRPDEAGQPEGSVFEYDEHEACYTNIDSITQPDEAGQPEGCVFEYDEHEATASNVPPYVPVGIWGNTAGQPSMPMTFSNGEPITGASDTTHVPVPSSSMQDNVDYIAASSNFEGQEVCDHVTTAMLLMPIERIKQLCVDRSISCNSLSSIGMITEIRKFHGINRNFSSSA